MELIFESLGKSSKHQEKDESKKSRKHGRKNMKLKKDIQAVLRQHKVKNMRKHINHMDGSGLFDSIVGAVSKGVKFYNDNKDTIHKVAKLAVEHAPKAIELYKKVKGGARSAGARSAGKRTLPPALKAWQEKCKEYAKKHNCSYREAMMKLKK